MFSARSCVGTVSGFNRPSTNQTNGTDSGLPLSRQLGFTTIHYPLPKSQFSRRNFSWRSSKGGDFLVPGATSKDSTEHQLDQLKDELARKDEEISKLRAGIVFVMQHLSKLQVERPEEIPNVPTKHQPNEANETPTVKKLSNSKMKRVLQTKRMELPGPLKGRVFVREDFGSYCDDDSDDKDSKEGDVDVTIGGMRDYSKREPHSKDHDS